MAVRKFRLTINGVVYEVEAEELDAQATPGVPRAAAASAAPTSTAQIIPKPPVTAPPAPPSKPRHDDGGITVEAPLPGAVLDVRAGVGQEVVQGQIIVILEAMKMENEITSPVSGKMVALHVQKGGTVSAQDPLFRVEP